MLRLTLLALALSLTACSGSDAPAEADEAPAEEAPKAAAEEAPKAAAEEAPKAAASAAGGSKSAEGFPEFAPTGKEVNQPLDQSVSLVQFGALKNGEVEVTGKFTAIGGGADIDPTDLRTVRGELDIDFQAVASGDAARDKNIAETFFLTAKPNAMHGNVQLTNFRPEKQTAKVGETIKADATLAVNMGVEITRVNVSMTLERLAENRWQFTLVDGFDLSIKKLGLGDRLTTLMKLCDHKSVADEVKATGKLVFGI